MAFTGVLIYVTLFCACAAVPTRETNPEEAGDFFEGDIMGHHYDPASPKSGVRNETARWPNGLVPYEISSNFTNEQRQQIMNGMRTISNKTCIRFQRRFPISWIFGGLQRDYVRFEKNQNGACGSFVGRQGGRQDISLANSCFDDIAGVIMHEIIHALGFYHEQTRPDRDSYIRILTENIEPGREPNFQKEDSSSVTVFGTAYDYDSIMHYPKNAFAKQEGLDTIEVLQADAVIGQRTHLSQLDIQEINAMYNC